MSNSRKRIRPRYSLSLDSKVVEEAQDVLETLHLCWHNKLMPGRTDGRNRRRPGSPPSISELVETLLAEFARVAHERKAPPAKSLGGFLFPRDYGQHRPRSFKIGDDLV